MCNFPQHQPLKSGRGFFEKLKVKDMKTLTLQHLAPYLPWGLKIYDGGRHMLKLPYLEMNANGGTHYNSITAVVNYQDKPILRPLSDAVAFFEPQAEKETGHKEPNELFIDHNGKVAMDFTVGGQTVSWPIDAMQSYMERFFEHHFDVFGLIDAGLAVDINTLNQ